MNKMYLLLFLSSYQRALCTIPPFLRNYSEWAKTTIQQLSLEEKVGQILMPSISVKLPEEEFERTIALLKKFAFGGIWLTDKGESCTHQIHLINTLQHASQNPLLVGQDQEWGPSMRMLSETHGGDTVNFPRALTLGAVQNIKLIEQLATSYGHQARKLGVHCTGAPVADINTEAANPVVGARSSGDNPENVSTRVNASVRGLQSAQVLACIKHFPGHGDTLVDSHKGLPSVPHDIQRLETVELYPFKKAIENNASMIMTAHICVPALSEPHNPPATMSPKILKDLLRNRMNFKGLAITDALEMKAITTLYSAEEAVIAAFDAGNDIILFPQDVQKSFKALAQHILTNHLEDELTQRVLKLLHAKAWLGIDKNRFVEMLSFPHDLVSADERALKKLLYQQAVTLHNYSANLMQGPITLLRTGEATSYLSQLCKQHFPDYQESLVTLSAEEMSFETLPTNKESTCILCIEPTQRGNWEITESGTITHQKFENLRKLYTTCKEKYRNVVCLLFSIPYIIDRLPTADNWVVGYELDNDAQHAVFEVLINKQSAPGILPITLGQNAAIIEHVAAEDVQP